MPKIISNTKGITLDKDDMNSRIKAFDYLIRVYTDKVNKSVIKQD